MTLDAFISTAIADKQRFRRVPSLPLPQWAAQRGYRTIPTFSDWQREFNKTLNPHTTKWHPHNHWYNESLAEWLDWFTEEEFLLYENEPPEPMTPQEKAFGETLPAQGNLQDSTYEQRKQSLRDVPDPAAYIRGLPLMCPVHNSVAPYRAHVHP
jgi:hypothetical protein